jgi:drug/metabolite transporter (DMT)-like permease
LYSAIQTTPPSDVVPVVGAVSAITTFTFAFLFLRQDLPDTFALAFVLLVFGTFLISHFRFTLHSFVRVFASGVLFGVSAFLIKLIFLETTFVDGFFWSRMTNVFGAFLLLLWPGALASVRLSASQATQRLKWLVLVNKALSGLAFVLILLAIRLGSVSVVNALSGLQFVFLIVFALLGVRWFPEVIRGEVHSYSFVHKTIGVIFIVFGFIALFIR